MERNVIKLKENKENILKWCSGLAMSQGLYGRLLRQLKEDDDLLTEMAEQNFKEPLDMVLWVEC